MVDWGLGGGRKKGKKQAEEAARTNRRRTKRRMAAERTARRDKYRRWRKRTSRCSFSCHSLLRPVPVRPGCLFRLFLSLLSPSSQPPIDRVSPNVALKLVTKPILWTGWVVWATNTWAVGLARRCRRRFDPHSRSFSLSSTSKFSSLSSTSIFISSRCSFSCHSPLCPVPVRPGCLFRLFLSLRSPSSQPPIDRVSPNVALKLVTKPILWTGWVVRATNTWAVGLAGRCRRRFDPRSRSFSLSSTSKFSSLSSTSILVKQTVTETYKWSVCVSKP